MMTEKARLFGDAEMRARIVEAEHPKEMKALGRKVRGFRGMSGTQNATAS